MSKFEVLCVTMNQTDFSKIDEMNIQSDVVFANQADGYSCNELEFNGHRAKMITTDQRGVGRNRNVALLHMSADICLLADDDVKYYDGYEEKILQAFDKYPDADIMIFNLSSDSVRKQKVNAAFRKCNLFSRMPYAAFRVAFRRKSIERANIWFTTLFGGGCVFPSGEDSIWLMDAKRKGLSIYVAPLAIGEVSFEKSTWFTGYNEKFFYGKGGFYQHTHRLTLPVWFLYFAARTRAVTNLSYMNRFRQMSYGAKDYRRLWT